MRDRNVSVREFSIFLRRGRNSEHVRRWWRTLLSQSRQEPRIVFSLRLALCAHTRPITGLVFLVRVTIYVRFFCFFLLLRVRLVGYRAWLSEYSGIFAYAATNGLAVYLGYGSLGLFGLFRILDGIARTFLSTVGMHASVLCLLFFSFFRAGLESGVCGTTIVSAWK